MFICKLTDYNVHHHHRTTHNNVSHNDGHPLNRGFFELLILILIISFKTTSRVKMAPGNLYENRLHRTKKAFFFLLKHTS